MSRRCEKIGSEAKVVCHPTQHFYLTQPHIHMYHYKINKDKTVRIWQSTVVGAMPDHRRTHREYVESKQGDAVRPTPATLTQQLIEENTLEACEKCRVVELLFIALAEMPGLQACTRLQELTIMHARLTQMPPELQLLKNTLRRLSLATNEIRAIEHLDGMAKLHTLFLHDNRISSCEGLGGCPGLQRLWLSTNSITSASTLPVSELGELRELWLQANPIESVEGIPELRNLQVLSLAGTRIRSLEQISLLVELPCLFELAFADGTPASVPALHFGPEPLSASFALMQATTVRHP